ncbi:inorganic pyrophosphatase [Rhodococcus sp. IC4_135]|uniref:inorganic pyrophosphatase n=1 Tax=Rhodococcus sp. IC4_135 TaxID=2715537 RepID=UPI0014244F36|nr:inorganic pyrophosphatase [Rhodococcus sp. IC4_135]
MSEDLFSALDHLAATSTVVIDRPRGSAHPRYPAAIYPLDYGYLDGTVSADGDGIDLFRGSAVGNGVVAMAVIADIDKKDVEVKILLECTADEIGTAAAFLRDTLGLGATVLRREVS